MTYDPNPPVMTHQPGSPADSASCKKPGGSPKPLYPDPRSLHDTLIQCNLNSGPVPEVGGLVWMWQIFSEKWQVYTVLQRYPHRLGGPRWIILNAETGDKRSMVTNKLYMPPDPGTLDGE